MSCSDGGPKRAVRRDGEVPREAERRSEQGAVGRQMGPRTRQGRNVVGRIRKQMA